MSKITKEDLVNICDEITSRMEECVPAGAGAAAESVPADGLDTTQLYTARSSSAFTPRTRTAATFASNMNDMIMEIIQKAGLADYAEMEREVQAIGSVPELDAAQERFNTKMQAVSAIDDLSCHSISRSF
jgi:hypothetical protein